MAPQKGKPTIETLVHLLFRDSVQFCSGLVDLVVFVGGDGGQGHRFGVPGERFVSLVAEDIAETKPVRVRTMSVRTAYRRCGTNNIGGASTQ